MPHDEKFRPVSRKYKRPYRRLGIDVGSDPETTELDRELRRNGIARLKAKLFELIARHESLHGSEIPTDPDTIAY